MLRKIFWTGLIFMLLVQGTWAQTSDDLFGFEFIDCDITEIVYAVSIACDYPMVCDDTVCGKGSFRFYGGDFETAFGSFLQANRLYADKEENRYVISRIRLLHDDAGLIQLDAFDISLTRLFEEISLECAVPVIHDVLPAALVSVHVANVDVLQAVKLALKGFAGYEAKEEEGCVIVEKTPAAGNGSGNGASGYYRYGENFFAGQPEKEEVPEKIRIECNEGLYSVDISDSLFSEVLEKLSEKSGMEFCSFMKNDSVLVRTLFSGRTFEETLELLCLQGNACWKKSGETYLFFTDSEVRKTLLEPLRTWETFDLEYASVDEVLPLVSRRFDQIQCLSVNEFTFVCCVTADEKPALDAFVRQCDKAPQNHLITLKYIQTDTFLNHLPPGYSKNQFVDTGSGNSLFFTGTKASFETLLEALEEIDFPATRIAYDLLIVQAQKSVSNTWSSSFASEMISPGDSFGAAGSLGSTLLFNIDVVSAFGWNFAWNLQSAVAENSAEIFADTTLHGVSGVPIRFRNTNTYRYRDPYLDSASGKTVDSGITREIVSGLVLEITGVASGDGMVTTSVTASFSRQGAESAGGKGNPPPTSEKLVTTQVRGRSGEVIVLSGLTQDDSTDSQQRTPWFSKIPLLGWLFKGDTKTQEKNEMVIYLIPRLENGTDQEALNE